MHDQEKWNSVMRKVIVLEHITLDGVIQAPGGPDEDTSGGFAYGGWIAPYSDEILGTLLRRQMNLAFDLLLGRRTFEIWEPYWPQHADAWPEVNTATKRIRRSPIAPTEGRHPVTPGADRGCGLQPRSHPWILRDHNCDNQLTPAKDFSIMITVGRFWYDVMRKLSRRECNNQTDQLDNPVIRQSRGGLRLHSARRVSDWRPARFDSRTCSDTQRA
jgi:hypothetical protein